MKARILLITILITPLITCKPNVLIKEKTCETWFPEPINKQAPQIYPYLKERLRMVDAFLSGVDYEEWIEFSKEYVVRSLDGDVVGGFEMMKIVLSSVVGPWCSVERTSNPRVSASYPPGFCVDSLHYTRQNPVLHCLENRSDP